MSDAHPFSAITIAAAIQEYLDSVNMARSENTAETYRFGLKMFASVLSERGFPPESTPTTSLPEESIAWFAAHLKVYTSATEALYLQSAKNFFEFLAAEGLASPNLPRIQKLIQMRSRRTGRRLPAFRRDDIERVLEYATNIATNPVENETERLINLRDRAFLLTLGDTGLRVHEACGLHRGSIDWNEGRAVIIGKGDQQAVVRFSRRSMQALKDYLAARSALDGASGKPLSSLPIFARHDKGAGKKVRPITTATGRNIVSQRVKEAIGESEEGKITPHSFRHYFVTTVLRGTNNLKLAQELARHKNIAVTQRYAHLSDDELDKGYWEVFERDLYD